MSAAGPGAPGAAASGTRSGSWGSAEGMLINHRAADNLI